MPDERMVDDRWFIKWVDRVTGDIERNKDCISTHDDRINTLEVGAARMDERTKASARLWGLIGGALSAILSIAIGLFVWWIKK